MSLWHLLREKVMNRAKSIAILGASGHGKVVAEIAELNGYEVTFFDDAHPTLSNLEHWSVKGTSEDLRTEIETFFGVFVAIGNNSVRAEKTELLLSLKANLITLIHPKAQVSSYAQLGAGTAVMAGAIVNPFVTTGKSNIINTGAVVEHDCKLGDFVHVSPNSSIAGACNLGDGVWFGIGSCSKQLISIGTNTTIGAGSVVVNDIPANSTAFGTPATVKENNK